MSRQQNNPQPPSYSAVAPDSSNSAHTEFDSSKSDNQQSSGHQQRRPAPITVATSPSPQEYSNIMHTSSQPTGYKLDGSPATYQQPTHQQPTHQQPAYPQQYSNTPYSATPYTSPPPAGVVYDAPMQLVYLTPAMAHVPQRMVCPFCRHEVITRIGKRSGGLAWLSCFGIFLFLPFGCCLIPFCLDDCKDTDHYCPNCHNRIATVAAC